MFGVQFILLFFFVMCGFVFFFFKQKTAYEMRISDWSSDVCSSDLFVSFLCSIDVNFLAGLTDILAYVCVCIPLLNFLLPQLGSQLFHRPCFVLMLTALVLARHLDSRR